MQWKTTAIAGLLSACLPLDGAHAQMSANAFLHMGKQNIEPESFVRKVSQSAATQAQTKAVADMPTRDNAILLGVQSDHPIVEKLGGGDADAYEIKADRFGRLLILAGKPSLLDAPETTEFFLPLIEIDRLEPFLDDMTYRLARSDGRGHLTKWKGDNQFAQEDSRLAFLASFRDEILSQVPQLPLRVDFVRRVSFGPYDGTALQLDIDGNSVWPSYNMVGLNAPEPFTVPTRWTVSATQARKVVEEKSSDPYGGPVVVTRAEITGVRASENDVTLDIAALNVAIYSDAGMTVELGTLPLPSGAVTVNAADPATAGRLTGIPFDPVLIRMLVASEDRQIADTGSFKYETFQMRRRAEDRMRSTEIAPPIDWPRLVPPSLTGTNAEPSQADLSKLDQWFGGALAGLNGNATISGFCWFDAPSTKCNLPDGEPLPLVAVAKKAIEQWDYGWNGLPDESEKVAAQAYSGNAGLLPFGAGRDVPGIVVLKAHEAWYGLDIPTEPITDAALDVAVRSHKILGTPSGKGFIAVEIEPTAFRYLSKGEWHTIMIKPPAEEQAAAPDSKYDVLGIKLGMPLAKAEEILAASFEGREVKRTEVRRDVNANPADPILGVSSSFRSPPFEIRSLPDGQGTEAINLFYDVSKPDHPVIAISRILRIGADSSGDAEQESMGRPVFNALVEKYGEPDKLGKLSYNDEPSLWVVSPMAKTRIEAGEKYCELDKMMSRAFENSSMFHSDLIQGDCGEILGAWFGYGSMSLFLADTSEILKLRRHYTEEESRAVTEREAAKPAVKF